MYKNLKNEYPNAPKSFHDSILNSVDSLPEQVSEEKHRRSPLKIAFLAAAVIAILTVTGFAANTVYESFINKQNYKVTLELGAETTDAQTETAEKTSEYVKLNFDYMPDYLVGVDAPYKYNLADDAASGLTFQLFKTELAKDLEITYAESAEECMFGKYKGAVIRINTGIESDGHSYDRQFLIYFDDFGYVLRCYVSENISDDEMMKIANGLSLEETDKEHAFMPDTYIPTVDNGGVIAPSDEVFSYTENAAVRQLGEEFSFKAFGRRSDKNNYTVSVKSIDIRDNVNGLNLSSFNVMGDDINDFIDENGNLKSYERKIYSYGDGVNSVNSLKKSKTVGRKLILAELQVRNDENSANYFYINSGICSVSGTSDANGVNLFEASYISGQDGNAGSYYYVPFEAGETKTLTYGFIVDADADFDDLMLVIECADGVSYGISVL